MRIVESEFGRLGHPRPTAPKGLLEGTMECWRDQWVELEPNQQAQQRKAYRNCYYTRKQWATVLGRVCRKFKKSRHAA
ncbi:MAG: hypothetical protein ACYSUI_20360 [Planctomycetota bacterium]